MTVLLGIKLSSRLLGFLNAFLLIVLIMQTSPPLWAGSQDCEELLSNQTTEFTKGKVYRLQIEGSAEILTVRSEAVDELAGIKTYRFTDLDSGQDLTFREGEIAGAVRPSTEFTLLATILGAPFKFAITAHSWAKLLFMPYRLLSEGERIEVFGTLISSKNAGEKISENLADFDKFMDHRGFAVPEMTRVIVNDRPVLPSLAGPFSRSGPVFSFWTGRWDPTIVMNPIFYNTKIAKDFSILFHERVHSILKRTYKKNAYVNQDPSFVEAIADFIAADRMGTPEIGPKVFHNRDPVRNILNRKSFGPEGNTRRNSILDITADQFHNNSVLISHVLWNLREHLSPEELDLFLKPFLDNLNIFRDGYFQPIGDPRQQLALDLEYILAVLLRTSENLACKESVRLGVAQSAAELHFSIPHIESVSKELVASKLNYAYNGKSNFIQGLVYTAYGVAGAIIDLELLFSFINH